MVGVQDRIEILLLDSHLNPPSSLFARGRPQQFGMGDFVLVYKPPTLTEEMREKSYVLSGPFSLIIIKHTGPDSTLFWGTCCPYLLFDNNNDKNNKTNIPDDDKHETMT